MQDCPDAGLEYAVHNGSGGTVEESAPDNR